VAAAKCLVTFSNFYIPADSSLAKSELMHKKEQYLMILSTKLFFSFLMIEAGGASLLPKSQE
jgi:hypothetical protein